MSRRVSFGVVLVLAGLSACTSGIGLSAPRAMNHPVDVAFACFDVSMAGNPMTRPLRDCQMFVDVSTNTRRPPDMSGLHMHALVTQSTRGEVGAVDLIARTELDSDMSVPGYTFVPVGELPTQIVVPPTDSSCTYVASRGPVDGHRPGISQIDTRRFRSGAGLDHNPFPLHEPYALPAAPSDMVLAPDEHALWVAMDALGVVVRIPIRSPCDLGPIDLVVPLYEDVPAGVDVHLAEPTDAHADGTTIDLTRMCTAPTPRFGVACSAATPRIGGACGATLPCPDGLQCLPTPDGTGYCTSTCDSSDPACSCAAIACRPGSACTERFGAPACFDACTSDAQCGAGQQCWVGVCQPACATNAQCGDDASCSGGRCTANACCTTTSMTCPLPQCASHACVGGSCAIPLDALGGCPAGLSCLRTPDRAGYCTFTCDPASTSCNCGSIACSGGSACNDRFGAPACFGACSIDGDCSAGQQCWGGTCQPACATDAQCGDDAACAAGRCSPNACTMDGQCRGGACANGFCPIPVATIVGQRIVSPVAPGYVGPRDPMADPRTEPEPVAIEIDEPNGLLLVADRALPMIHRVRMSDGTLDTPIATGVPVRDVVVTPRVPDSYQLVPDTCAPDMVTGRHLAGSVVPAPASSITFSRYLYAIDDTDGTVMAIEYSRPGAPGFGGVIPAEIHGARRSDRIGMPIVARTLEIITPQYDTTAEDPRIAPHGDTACDPPTMGNRDGFGLCLPSDPAPTQPPSPTVLRGVFLVVAGADGALRFVDVYDLDAPCRGRALGNAMVTFDAHGYEANDCTAPTFTNDLAVYVRRHRPRAAQPLASFVTIASGPSVNFPGGGSQVLGTDGLPVGHDPTMPVTTPTLATLWPREMDGSLDYARAACPSGLGQVWGGTETDGSGTPHEVPIVCSLVDPFAAIAETWTATFEGTIPGTRTSSANAQTDDSAHTLFNGHIDTRLDYCALGVIGTGEATAPAGEPEALYAGDMMSILTAMPAVNLEADPARCYPVVGITQVGQTQLPILVRIEHALSTPDMQQEPYTGQLFVEPTTPLEQRGAATAATCADTSECATAEYPSDACDDTGHCVHFPTIADAIRCYGDTLLTIDVRSRGAFTVNGSRSGFQTRVVRGADGTCVYDLDPTRRLRQGHAFNDVLFQNHRIAFRPRGGTTVAEIRMVLSGGPSQLGIDLSQSSNGTRGMALPAGLRYSPEMWALYAIEAERGGLVELTLRPLARTSTAYQ